MSKTKEYENLVLDQCRHIMDAFPGTQAANFAMNLMLWIRAGLARKMHHPRLLTTDS